MIVLFLSCPKEMCLIPPNDAPPGTDHTRLEHEYKGLYRFFKGGAKLPSLKRESMFVQLLEGLSAEETELLVLIKDGLM